MFDAGDSLGSPKINTIIFILFTFSVIWIGLLIPSLQANNFYNLPQIFHFPLVQFGFYGLSISLIYFYNFFMQKKQDLKNTAINGIYGWSLVSFVADVWMPPYSVSSNGMINNFSNNTLYTASGDYFLYSLIGRYFQDINLFNFSLAYIIVYVLIPTGILISYMLLKKGRKND